MAVVDTEPRDLDLGTQEAFEVLHSFAQGRFGAIPPELLVRHVLTIAKEADWPVARSAMEATIRRFGFAKRDELRVAKRPARRRIFGTYQTKRQRSRARPYTTQLQSIEPLRASCDCPDFAKNSLGLCKHVLAVLGETAKKPVVFEQARRQSGPVPALCWDPIRPMTGEGDWLTRIRWTRAVPAALPKAAATKVERWFHTTGERAGEIRDAAYRDPDRRLGLVGDLLRLAEPASSGIDPALAAMLSAERLRLEQRLAGRLRPRDLRRHLASLKRKLYAYQLEGVSRFLDAGRLLLADDMGLGKTAQAIAACHILFRAGRVRRGLVIVPASLKPQWLREWQCFSAVPAAVVEGSPAERRALYESTRRGFLIANYEQLWRDLDIVREWDPEMAVLDEAQRIKNWATKTAAYVKQLAPAYRLVLTGTPMENRLQELASILEWVEPLALEPAWRLGPWHTITGDGRGHAKGARNLDTLRARLSTCMVRRIRQEVLKQLPPRTDTRVSVELTGAQRQEHDELNQPIASIIRRAKTRPLTQGEFLRLMQLLTTQRIICNGLGLHQFREIWPGIEGAKPSEGLRRSLTSPKLEELRNLVSSLVVEQNRKVVIFSQWRRMLQLADWAVGDLLSEAGKRAVYFTGQEGQKRRTHNLVDFHDDPSCAVLFATDAGGVGLNLQRAANCCINIELPWNPAVLEQRIGRIYRLGQPDPIEVYNLVCEEGIEARIHAIVGNKQALFTGLFDGNSDEVNFEGAASFIHRVEAALAPAVPPSGQEDDGDEDLEALEDLEADEVPDETVPVPVSTPAAASAGAVTAVVPALPAERVAQLFSQLDITAAPDGSVTIKAPPAAAATLAAVFQGMAQTLAAAATPPPLHSLATIPPERR